MRKEVNMSEKELHFIVWALLEQGLFVGHTASGFWVIRDVNGRTVTYLLPDADEVDWHNALLDLKQRGILIWPPDR